jgi:hypothetical protein
MALSSTHPLFDKLVDDQVLMRDAYDGERAIKAKTTNYLPPTPGMVIDGMDSSEQAGRKIYDNYLLRAVFPDHVKEAVDHNVGLLHQKPATIELPKRMEPLLKKATIEGEGLQTLLRRINSEQLITGRLGMLLDIPTNPPVEGDVLPYIVMYCAESIRNWDDGSDFIGENNLSLVVLDETGIERDNSLQWTREIRYRVLLVEDGVYKTGTFEDSDSYSPETMLAPLYRGKPLNKIPFVFVNTKDIIPKPDNPPFLGLGRLALAIYRGEADYRQALFLQGQDTLVVIGGTNQEGVLRTGAGARIDVDIEGDAKYIGVNSAGLPELRMSLENDKKAASIKAGHLIDATGNKQESGEALKTRLAAQTATLNQIALASASALETILKMMAEWIGENPEDVSVKPNLEFADLSINPREFVDMMTARTMGAPISHMSIHAIMQEKGLTKMTFEEEITQIQEEDAANISLMRNTGGAV